jgi:hypothetical protein
MPNLKSFSSSLFFPWQNIETTVTEIKFLGRKVLGTELLFNIKLFSYLIVRVMSENAASWRLKDQRG